jgi:hypothetical protein
VTRVWKDRTGPWGEAQKILHVEASAVLELLKGEVTSTEPNQRVIDSRMIAISHARESMSYLLLGDVPMAANHLIWADAWRALSLLTEDQHDAMGAEASAGTGAAPLVREIRKSGALVLGEPCDTQGCTTPGHELETVDDREAMAQAARELGLRPEVRARRCLGPRNGFHRVLALVPRPPASRGKGPTRRGPLTTWRP